MTSRAEVRTESCPSCDSAATATMVAKGRWQLWRCSDCDLAFQRPLPTADAIDELYGGGYFSRHYGSLESAQRAFFSDQIRALRPLVNPGIAIDVGCGTGLFLDELGPAWQRIGIDYSDHAVAEASARDGIAATTAELGDLDAPIGGVNLITFWDALEHFPSPAKPLAAARRLLSADGILVVKVPHMRRILFALAAISRLVGGGRHPFYPDAHLLHFNPRSLRACLERAGFEVLATNGATDPHPAKFTGIGPKPLAKFLIAVATRNPIWRDSIVALARPSDAVH